MVSVERYIEKTTILASKIRDEQEANAYYSEEEARSAAVNSRLDIAISAAMLVRMTKTLDSIKVILFVIGSIEVGRALGFI